MNENGIRRVLVTGGAGYVGAVLVPRLLAQGYQVRVLDLYLFGDHVLDAVRDHGGLEQIHADIRNEGAVRRAVDNCDAVIHLACISNDPSFELNPALSRSVNYECFEPLVRLSREAGVRRFVYVSTSSVYGISEAENVDESHPLVPITDYNRYKALCEPVLLEHQNRDFAPIIIRPATVCGYSPRLRLDLTVNLMTNHAVSQKEITVFGGSQRRPNIHIDDVVDLYRSLLEFPAEQIAGRTYNAGYENHAVSEIAEMVRDVVHAEWPELGRIPIVTTASDDRRSYHISSEKIRRELGFSPRRTLETGVRDLVRAFRDGRIPDSMTDPRYYNIKTMQRIHLS